MEITNMQNTSQESWEIELQKELDDGKFYTMCGNESVLIDFIRKQRTLAVSEERERILIIINNQIQELVEKKNDLQGISSTTSKRVLNAKINTLQRLSI